MAITIFIPTTSHHIGGLAVLDEVLPDHLLGLRHAGSLHQLRYDPDDRIRHGEAERQGDQHRDDLADQQVPVAGPYEPAEVRVGEDPGGDGPPYAAYPVYAHDIQGVVEPGPAHQDDPVVADRAADGSYYDGI
jgi:hypothetical protein